MAKRDSTIRITRARSSHARAEGHSLRHVVLFQWKGPPATGSRVHDIRPLTLFAWQLSFDTCRRDGASPSLPIHCRDAVTVR